MGRFDSKRYPQSEYFNKVLGKRSHKHIALDDFHRLPESRESYARFTFVRNPYDRLYSGFLQRKKKFSKKPPKRFLPDKFKEERAAVSGGFREFVAFYMETKKERLPLSQFAYHDGRPAIDYVGFLETFEASFSQICDRVGIQNPDGGNDNVQFSGLESEMSRDASEIRFRYLDKYDSETLEILNENAAQDFQIFGYRMISGDEFAKTGAVLSAEASPFSDGPMPERDGAILAFDRSGT